MASKINFTDALHKSIQDTLEQLQGCKWRIHEENLADNALDIDVKKATVAVYRKHAQTIAPEAQKLVFSDIEKIERKLYACLQVVNHIESNSRDLDPRVSRVNEKLIQLKTLEKIKKYTALLEDLSEESNLPTTDAIDKTLAELKGLRIGMLRAQPECKVCDLDDNLLVKQYHTNNPNPALCLKAGKEQASVRFFIEMLTTMDEDGLERLDKSFWDKESIEYLIKNCHDSVAKNPDLGSPFCDIFDRDQHEEICQLALKRDHCLLPPDVTFECLESSINALLAVKHQHKLSDVCALVRFNDSHLALAIDKKNIIYLFNQYGNAQNNFRPFIMAFGTPGQATDTLLAVLQNHPDSIKGPITLAAVCDRYEFNDKTRRTALSPVKLETPPLTLEAACPPLFHLQNVIEALSPCTEDGYELALGIIPNLNVDGYKFNSPINGDKDREILDRIFFHLYHIQNKDRPSVINREDGNWGSSAFQSDVLSTPEEKLRAVQRTQVEVLALILTQIDFDNAEALPAISLFLEALERLKMHPNDLPQGSKNLAYYLFGNLYNTYKAAWTPDQKMIHPDHSFFEGDFGRNAFVKHNPNPIPIKFKVQVVQELVQSLKKAWDL